ERRRYDLVPRAGADGLERQEQSIGTARAADRVRRVGQRGDVGLKVGNGFAKDEGLVVHYAHHLADNVVADTGVLRAQVEKGNGHGPGARRLFIVVKNYGNSRLAGGMST